MAHQPGTRAKAHLAGSRPARAMPAAARLIGTIILGGFGVALIAATALLPAYASLRTQQYRRDREAANVAYMQAHIRGNGNVLAAAASDPVFIERLALSIGELVPTDKVPFGPSGMATTPDVVIPAEPTPPQPPPQWLLATAERIDRPGISRGLYVMGAGVLLATMLLFGSAPPARDPKEMPFAKASRADHP